MCLKGKDIKDIWLLISVTKKLTKHGILVRVVVYLICDGSKPIPPFHYFSRFSELSKDQLHQFNSLLNMDVLLRIGQIF